MENEAEVAWKPPFLRKSKIYVEEQIEDFSDKTLKGFQDLDSYQVNNISCTSITLEPKFSVSRAQRPVCKIESLVSSVKTVMQDPIFFCWLKK